MLFSFFFFFQIAWEGQFLDRFRNWKKIHTDSIVFYRDSVLREWISSHSLSKRKRKKKKGQKISEKNRTFNECFQRFLLLVTIWPWFDSMRAFLREESNARPSGIYAILIVHGVHLVSIVSAVTSAACISFRWQWLNWPSRLKFPLRWVIYPVARYSLSRCS